MDIVQIICKIFSFVIIIRLGIVYYVRSVYMVLSRSKTIAQQDFTGYQTVLVAISPNNYRSIYMYIYNIVNELAIMNYHNSFNTAFRLKIF